MLKGSPPVAPQRPHPLSGANRGRPLRICGRSGTTRRQPFPTGYLCSSRDNRGLLEAQIATSSAPPRVYGRHRRPERGAGPQRGARRYRGARHATAELCHTLFATPPRSAALPPPRPAGARRYSGESSVAEAWRGAPRSPALPAGQRSATARRRASSHADAPPPLFRQRHTLPHAPPRGPRSSSERRWRPGTQRRRTSVQERNQSMISHTTVPFAEAGSRTHSCTTHTRL